MLVSLTSVSVTVILLRDGVVSPKPNPPLLPGLGTGWIYPDWAQGDCTCQIGGISRIARGDGGTDNVFVSCIQRFLPSGCDDEFSCDKSFLYGRSVS